MVTVKLVVKYNKFREVRTFIVDDFFKSLYFIKDIFDVNVEFIHYNKDKERAEVHIIYNEELFEWMTKNSSSIIGDVEEEQNNENEDEEESK